tara:strand:+ start:37 stop:492 length:456 start_codon:yes stop_codon:yes gene_type:complete
MNDIEEKLMNRINEVLNDNIEAINVKVFGVRNQKSVQIIIESTDGVTIQTCSNVTKIAQNIIKLDEIIESDYNIEVSSPGINRPLFNLKDFIKYQGEKAFVELKRNINNHKRFTGIYKIINNKIVFQDQNSPIEISIENIKKANLIREIKV